MTMNEPNKKQRKKQKFEPFKVKIGTKIYWQVNLESESVKRADGSVARVRPRRTFSTAEEARTFAQLKRVERANHGTVGISMDETERGQFREAQKILAPSGATVVDAAREYMAHRELVTTSETVTNAVTSLLAAKHSDNLRPRYLKNLRVDLTRFANDFGERKLAGISPIEIDRWLRGLGLSPLGRNTLRSRISVLFAYGCSCDWTTTNPISEVRKVKVTESIPGILTPEQAARLLEAADPQTLPYWVLGLFCGLRTAELERLSWTDIHFEKGSVEVPSLASKTASRRFVPLRPNAALWLEPYQKIQKMQGALCPSNLRTRLETDRAKAGIAKWPSNGTRHSFGSYHLGAFQNAALCAAEMGHISAAITYRHYNQRVRPAVAQEFWRIVPAVTGTALKVVA
jgi:integrase